MALTLIGRTGLVAGRDVKVKDLLRIGAAEDNEFRLVVSGVSRHHARITRTGDAWFLEDAGSTNGTFLNGQRVVKERLGHLDVVTLGRDIDLIVVSSNRADTAPPVHTVAAAWLESLDGGGAARTEVALGEITLGRLAPSNVIIDSVVVSHLHARIQRTPDHLILQDLDSVNGTYVNGKRITGPVVLNDGDVLAIAGVRKYTVHVTGDGRAHPQEVVTSQTMVHGIGQSWQTKMVWSDEELALLEEERRKFVEAARAVQKPAASAAPVPPKPPAAAPAAKAAPVAPKPPVAEVAPVLPKPPAAEVAPVLPKPVAPAPQGAPAALKPPLVVSAPKPAPPPKAPPQAAAPAAPAAPVAPAAPAAPAALAAPAAPVAPVVSPPKAVPKSSVPAPPATPTVIVTASDRAAAAAMAQAPKARGARLIGPMGAFVLEKGRHVVGRNEGVAVPILDLQVSRSHAVIAVDDQGVTVEDTRSANGTFVNGTRVEGKAVALKHGDKVAFGKVELMVELIS